MHEIKLAHLKPLAAGAIRYVFAHPGDPDLLIKVIRADAIEQRFGSGRPWYKMTRRYRHFVSYLREVREEIAMRAQGAHLPSLQKIVGFADTDLGFGLVVAAAKDRDGNLAPTLPRLISDGGFDQPARAALDCCLQELLDSPVVLADLHGANLVYAWTEPLGQHFVLIDGIGCKTLFPFSRMSRTLNRYAKRRQIERLHELIERRIKRVAADREKAEAKPHQTASV